MRWVFAIWAVSFLVLCVLEVDRNLEAACAWLVASSASAMAAIKLV